MKPLLAFVLLLSLSLSSLDAAKTKGKASEPKSDKAQIEEMTRLEIFLDRANFGPGKIDGKDGEFVRKALAYYRQSQNLGAGTEPASPAAAKQAPLDTKGLDLKSVDPVFVPYTVVAEDLASVGPLPEGLAEQAKGKAMPYRNGVEAVAEKFHSSAAFLKSLNPTIKADTLKAGDVVTVPNVEPFELSQVKQIKPGEELETDTVSDSAESDAEKPQKGEKSSKAKAETAADNPASTVKIAISIRDKTLVVWENDQIKAEYPITPGSSAIPSPVGTWKIERIAKMPNFRWDEKMLKEGVRSGNAHLLPPGPNNPVGVMWIALNKKGIGIHGTSDPETIGRAASHGCIRLANWDVVKLAKLIKPGVSVVIE